MTATQREARTPPRHQNWPRLVIVAISRPASTRASIVHSTLAVEGHVSAWERSSWRGAGKGCCRGAGAGCESGRRPETLCDSATGSETPETTRGSANVRVNGNGSGSASGSASVSRRCLGHDGGGTKGPRPATHTTTPLYVLYPGGGSVDRCGGCRGCRGVCAPRVTCQGASGDSWLSCTRARRFDAKAVCRSVARRGSLGRVQGLDREQNGRQRRCVVSSGNSTAPTNANVTAANCSRMRRRRPSLAVGRKLELRRKTVPTVAVSRWQQDGMG